MKGVNISNLSNSSLSNKEWFEIYHDTDNINDRETGFSFKGSLLGDHDLVIVEEPSIMPNHKSMSLLMPHDNGIVLTDHLSRQNDVPEPTINMKIITNTGSCGCSKVSESFSTNIGHDGPLITESDTTGQERENNHFEKNNWDLSTKVYVGSITIIGLYVLFRSMQKSI